MVKPPRHSKPKSDPVTIDLDEKDVKQVKPAAASATDASQQTVSQKTPSPTTPSSTTAKNTSAKTNAKTSATAKMAASAKPKPTADPTGEHKAQDKAKDKSAEKPFQSAASATSAAFNSASKIPPNQADSSSSSGTMGLISASIIGGVIALGGAYGLQKAGLITSGTANTPSTDIAAQVSNLEQQLLDINGQLNAERAAQTGEQVDMLTGLAPLETRMDDLETLVQNDNQSTLTALNNMNIEMEGLIGRLSALENAPATNGDKTPSVLADLSDFQTQLDDLLRQLADMQADIEADQQAIALLPALQEQLSVLKASQSASKADMLIARNLATTSIIGAIGRGDPFETELNAFRQIDPEHSALDGLSELAKTGVATQAELIALFDAIANEMVASDRPQADNDGVFSRLMESATSLVKVRQVGNIDGTSTEAVVARMETKLQADDLAGTSQEWESLSDAAKQISARFKAQLDQRLLADKLAQTFMTANGG